METNNSNALEGRITIVIRYIKGNDGKVGKVERYVVDGEKVVYMDVLTHRMFCYQLERPDLLTALQRFCTGDGGLYMSTMNGSKNLPSNVEFKLTGNTLTHIRPSPTGWRRIVECIRNWNMFRR